MSGRLHVPRFWPQLLLATVMLLMQHAGVLHALRHATRDDAATSNHATCLECLSHQAHDQAVAHAVPVLALMPLRHAMSQEPGLPQCVQGVCAAYRPRAPPAIAFA